MRFIAPRLAELAEIIGVADLRGMPHFLEGMVRMGLRSGVPKWPVLMDLEGSIASGLGVSPAVLRIVVLDRSGAVVLSREGAFSESVAEEIVGSVRKLEVRK
jgi:predicted transcriptional regulator